MNFKLEISFSEEATNTLKGLVESLSALSKAPAEKEPETSKIDVSEMKKKGRPKKEKAVEEAKAEDEVSSEEDLNDEESFDEEEGLEEEETYISEKDRQKLLTALKAYKAKHSMDEAMAILKKYAKQSDKVKAGDFPKLMKALKV